MNKKIEPVKFPKDESLHNCIIEWWYFNGHLKDKSNKEYSFMDCLFKVDVKKVNIPFLNSIPLKTSYFSHSLVSDIKRKKFSHRISPFSLVSEDSFSKPLLYINYMNPVLDKKYINCAIEKIDDSNYFIKNEDIELKMTSKKTALLEGGKGFLDLNSKKTYYYSLTNLKTEGRIRIKGKWIDVKGKSWMDHQWADTSYTKDKWTWFSIQLNNDTEMVCCLYDDGKVKTYFADISYENGRQEHYRKVEIIPFGKAWKSLKSKAVYPLNWEIKIPEKNISIRLEAKIKNQEMLFGSINYWEGPLNVKGLFNGKEIKGVGFMELVGYPSRYNNVSYIKDELSKMTGIVMLAAKNEAMTIVRKLKKEITGQK